MAQLPTYWFRTEYFWTSEHSFLVCFSHLPIVSKDYPHWDMLPELKHYQLMQAAYWCQQLIVLVLRLEKPRKDYRELVAHHLVTLWLIGYAKHLISPSQFNPFIVL